MGNRRESELQRDVLAYLKEQRIWHWRTQMGQDSGVPDIICVIAGRFVGIELKREDGTGKTTMQQYKTMRDLNEAGAIAERISSLQEVKELVKNVRDNYDKPIRSLDIPTKPIPRTQKVELRMGGLTDELRSVNKTVFLCPNCRAVVASNIVFLPTICPTCGQKLKRE